MFREFSGVPSDPAFLNYAQALLGSQLGRSVLPSEQKITNGLQGLHELTQQPDVRLRRLMTQGLDMQQDLFSVYSMPALSGGDSIPGIDRTAWEEIIDDNQPTLGLRTHVATTGNILLAAAAQRLRADGEAICNIVLLPERTFSHETPYKNAYVAHAGILVQNGIRLRAGEFIEPLPIDALPSTGMIAGERVHKAVRYINEPAIEALIHDKEQARKSLEAAGIGEDTVLAWGLNANDDRVLKEVSAAYDDNRPIVIKPIRSQQGKGVIMVDPAVTPEEYIEESLRTTYCADDEVIIERWLQSLPLSHPTTGVRQDWNIRAVVMGGQLAGAYARVGTHGTPVNMATGAIAQNLEDVLGRCGLDDADKALVHTRLETYCHKLYSAIPANCIGADIIINKDLQPELIELNGEHSGGLYNAMRAGRSITNWEPAIIATRSLHQALFNRRRLARPRKLATPLPIEVDSTTLLDDIYNSDMLLPEHINSELLGHLKSLRKHSPGLRELADRCIRFSKWQADPFSKAAAKYVDKYVKNNPAAGLVNFRQYYHDKQFGRAYDELERYAAREPDNFNMQFRAAAALEKVFVDAHGHNGALFNLIPLSPTAARSHARAALLTSLRDCNLDPLALSRSTYHNLERALTAAQDGWFYEGPLLSLRSVDMSDSERTYLEPLSRYMNGRRALEQADTESLNAIIMESLSNPNAADMALHDAIMERLSRDLANNPDDEEVVLTVSPSTCSITPLLTGRPGLGLSFVRLSKDTELFQKAYVKFCERELEASGEPMTDEQASDLASQMLHAHVALQAGDLVGAESTLRHVETLMHGFTSPPFKNAREELLQNIAEARNHR